MSWILFVIISLFFTVEACSVQEDDGSELVLVSVMFRHGARTTYSFYPNDPNKGEDFYPFGLGGLTNEGKLGEYKLGLYLKNLYGDFLGEDWTEDKVWVRSTDVTRTKMSAQLVLAGLFPPSDKLLWNDQLLWLPIPVQYTQASQEDLFHPTSNCPYKMSVLNNLDNIQEVQDTFINPYKKLFKEIQEQSGKTINNPYDLVDLFFTLKCEDDMNLILPNWTQSVYPDPIEQVSSLVYSYHNFDARVKQINSGYLLKKILDDSKDKMNGKNTKRKIFLYSGHESTMGYMLDALHLLESKIPPYGSALSFELRRLDDKFFIKLNYRNETEGVEPVVLSLPGCSSLCPYEDFVQILDDVLPQVTIAENCLT